MENKKIKNKKIIRGGSLSRREGHRGGVGVYGRQLQELTGARAQKGRQRAPQNALQRPFARFEEGATARSDDREEAGKGVRRHSDKGRREEAGMKTRKATRQARM